MSSHTVSIGNIGNSYLGVADPVKFVDPMRLESNRDIYSRRIHGPEEKEETIKYTMIIIIISAIIFVTIIAIYDVLRSISNYYTNKFLINSDSPALIVYRNALIVSTMFAAICIISSLILIPLLLSVVKKISLNKN